jgi:hypothetical protein
MGNVYDVLAAIEEPSKPKLIRPATAFQKTERAIKNAPFDSFYTVNMTNEKP